MGVAGSGKSAIAHTIARVYDGHGSARCIASLARMSRSRTPSVRLRSICHPQFKIRALEGSKRQPSYSTIAIPSRQFDRILVQPSRNAHGVGPLLVVIDALDENGDLSNRQQILSTLPKQIAGGNLPPHLRFPYSCACKPCSGSTSVITRTPESVTLPSLYVNSE